MPSSPTSPTIATLPGVNPHLPSALRQLLEIAYNFQWSFSPSAQEAFRRLDPILWDQTGHNPIRVLAELPPARDNWLALTFDHFPVPDSDVLDSAAKPEIAAPDGDAEDCVADNLERSISRWQGRSRVTIFFDADATPQQTAAVESYLAAHADLAKRHFINRDEALARLQKTLELDQNFWVTHLMLGRVYIQQRRYPEAIAELSKARELSRGNSEAIGSIGYAEASAGDKEKARAVLEELKALSQQRYIPPSNMGLVYCGLGDKDEALSCLEQACDERDPRLTLLKVDPRWDSLRDNARFVAILKRIGLQ